MSSSRLSTEEIQHIALLCRLGMSEEDIERFRNQLSHILENFEILTQVDVTGVPITEHSGSLSNVMREDEAKGPSDKEDMLANAPIRENDFFKVKAVLD